MYTEHNLAFFSQHGHGRSGRAGGWGFGCLSSRGRAFTPASRYNTVDTIIDVINEDKK